MRSRRWHRAPGGDDARWLLGVDRLRHGRTHMISAMIPTRTDKPDANGIRFPDDGIWENMDDKGGPLDTVRCVRAPHRRAFSDGGKVEVVQLP